MTKSIRISYAPTRPSLQKEIDSFACTDCAEFNRDHPAAHGLNDGRAQIRLHVIPPLAIDQHRLPGPAHKRVEVPGIFLTLRLICGSTVLPAVISNDPKYFTSRPTDPEDSELTGVTFSHVNFRHGSVALAILFEFPKFS